MLGPLLLAAAAFAQFQGLVVYDGDDRRELHQLTDARQRAMAETSVALFAAASVADDGTVTAPVYGRHYKLCPSEPFWHQPSGSDCSGTLIGPDLVLTAGHCVTSRASCAATKFVFGWAYDEPGRDLSRVSPDNVYRCGRLLGRRDDGKIDWALVRLDRPVSGRRPARVSTLAPRRGTPLVIAGFPSGLPLKIAAGANVTRNVHRDYFEADVDAFGGSSGSGVFHAETGELLGVLVRGEADDFVKKGSCKVSNLCRGTRRCGGQDITRASSVYLPPELKVRPLAAVLEALEKR